MTLKQLEDIRYLQKEIDRYSKQLVRQEREQKSISVPAEMRTEYDKAVKEYRQILIEIIGRRTQELETVKKFIDSIADPFMKSILIERLVKGKKWWDVAEAVSCYGTYSAQSLQQHFSRYLRKCGISTD